MKGRIIEISNLKEAEKELLSIGSDDVGIRLMAPKAMIKALKIKGVSPPAANIIKQEMLSLGGEAATAYGSINYSVDWTDLLILGTLKQLEQLIEKLKLHQFGLPGLSSEINLVLNNYDAVPKAMKIGKKIFEFGQRTYIMGVLNMTPDSFSDGGKFSGVSEAVLYAKQMIKDGADLIDVGGESTRPFAEPVSLEEEKKRVLPVIERLSAETDTPVSIDTMKGEVAKAALLAGASMVNDVSGLHFDENMARVGADFSVPVCIMHIKGTPRDMQEKPSYSDLLGEIIDYLEEGVEFAKKAGILHEKIMVDPGIGFGKTIENNLEIFKRLKELKVLGCPILIGPSRKSVIGKVLGLPVDERLEGTAAAVSISIANGADIIRVHDVKEMSRVAKMVDAIVRPR